ncbi:MAG: EamA family transporter [Anaerolineae bacterium]|nr:MAG: EamA family transporter [Anaerolineae bacterium]
MGERTGGYLLVTGAAALWGMLVIFYHHLVGLYGVAPLEVAFFRAAVSAIILGVALAVWRPALLRLRRRDLPLFVAFGLLGVTTFFVVYVYAIRLTGGATAAVLLYTAPTWVTLIAWQAFGEPLTRTKLVALGLSSVGCILVARAYNLTQLRLDIVGVLFGLASGLTYGLYTLFNKRAVQRYSPWTAMFYALGLGGLFLLPWQSPSRLWAALSRPASALWLLALALGPTLGAYLLLGKSLERLPASVVSIVATSEPVIAAVLAWAFLGQSLTPAQIAGGGAVLAGVLLLQRENRSS